MLKFSRDISPLENHVWAMQIDETHSKIFHTTLFRMMNKVRILSSSKLLHRPVIGFHPFNKYNLKKSLDFCTLE